MELPGPVDWTAWVMSLSKPVIRSRGTERAQVSIDRKMFDVLIAGNAEKRLVKKTSRSLDLFATLSRLFELFLRIERLPIARAGVAKVAYGFADGADRSSRNFIAPSIVRRRRLASIVNLIADFREYRLKSASLGG